VSPPAIWETLNGLLRARIEGRKWILAFDVAAGATPYVAELQRLGAADVLVLAGTPGMGPAPDAATHLMDTHGSSMMAAIRAVQSALAAPSEATLAAIEAFDPDARAHVLPTLFGALPMVAGRPVFGVREPAWMALEDKMRADALWDAVGIPRSPMQLVAAREPALRAAFEQMQTGSGTVWAGDAKQGWHGGATHTRWVSDAASFYAAVAFFTERCDRVRVMPFLDGQPCSIHGLVGSEGTVVALRPCEAIILPRRATGDFAYWGTSTTWDPPAARREEMRSMVRRVGRHLHETLGYRAAFTFDGVMTADGFRPTELNPRFGGALGAIGRCLDGLNIYLLNQLMLEGGVPDALLPELERAVLEIADAKRFARAAAFVRTTPPGDLEERLNLDGVSGTLKFGPGPTGGRVVAEFDGQTVPAGAAIAPYARQAFALADRLWGTGIRGLPSAQ